MNETMGEPSMIDRGVLKTNPFPGIRPFTSAEDKYFFGRDAVISEVLDLLHDNRFVALVGSSASGKTSLIQSGIIPALITDKEQEWVPVSVRPGTKPIENLIRGFQLVFPKKLKEADIQPFQSGAKDLGDLIIEKGLGSHNYFLVVDQFEELFRNGTAGKKNTRDPEIRRFVDQLVKAVRDERPGIYVMLSIRSDFIEASATFRSLTELMNRSKYLLPQMSKQALSDSISGPVQQAGARLEPGFVDYVLDEIEEIESPLPQLQHALKRTWDYWTQQGETDQPLSISDYQAIGSVKSALSQHLEEAFEELDETQQAICEKMFKSITSKSDHHNGFKRQATIGNISRIVQCSLEELTDVIHVFRGHGRNFLSPLGDVALNTETVLELSHESLIRIWDRLHTWVDEEAESIKMYTQLSEASAMYQQGRAELLRPPELQIALNWRDSQKPTPSWGVQYNPAFERAMVFLSTSEEEFSWGEERKVLVQKRRLFLNRAIAIGMAALVTILAIVFFTNRNKPVEDPETDQLATQDLSTYKEVQDETQTTVTDNREGFAVEEPADEGPFLQDEGEVEMEPSIRDQGRSNETASDVRRSDTETSASSTRNQRSTPTTSKPASRPASTQPVANNSAAEAEFERKALDLAGDIARLSTELVQDPDLQGLLAYQSFKINSRYNGKYYDRDIYSGLYAALKKLISPAFNIYPSIRSSVKDIQWLKRTGSILTVSSDGSVKILSGRFADRASQISLENTGQNNECLVVSPDERMAAVGTNGGGLLFLELENRGAVVNQNSEAGNIVLFLSNLGTTGSFISAGTDNRILKWDYDSGTSSELVSTGGRPSAMAASWSGRKVAFGTRDGKLYELNVNAPDQINQAGEFGRNHVGAITYSPAGQYLVVGLLDGSLRVLAGEDRRLIATLRGPEARVTDLAYSPDGKFLAAGSHDGRVYLWSCTDWNNPPIVFDENNGFVLSVCFSENSNYFYSGSVDYPRFIGRPSESAVMANDFCSLVGRDLTVAEWDQYFGGDIPFEKTCPEGN
jgi:WD40 repeat protein